MKIYRVYYEEITMDGRFYGYKTKGYYTTLEKAETVKNELKPCVIIGKTYIEEIEVEE